MAGLWDMFNWYSWYFPPSPDQEEETPTIEKEQLVPKKKKRTTRTKRKTIPKDAIPLVLPPNILKELETEAQESESTVNQIIENILTNYFEPKDEEIIEPESWLCTYCDPKEDFSDYFKYSEHFFSEHLQPNLQKLSNVNYNQKQETIS